MKFLFLSHYYSPEGNAPASRVSALAERWVAAGHEVTVVTCAPNVPNGVVYDGYENGWHKQEKVNGVNVVRVWTYIAANKGTSRRILNFLSYMLSAVWRGMRLPRPDVIIATSPQFFCGWAGVLLHWLRRVPFVLEIRDIWPESMSAVNVTVSKPAMAFLTFLERKMYRSADHIVTVGEGYSEQLLSRGVPLEKIDIVMNGVDRTQFFPQQPDQELLARYGLTDKFIVSYIGTIGMACGLTAALEAAKMLQEKGRDDIRIVFVGDGAVREQLETEAATMGLKNVVFTGRRPKAEMPAWVSASNANLVHLRKNELFTTVMPSKIFESAGCARPILMGIDGFAKKLVLDAEAGVGFEPDNALEMADCILRLADDPELCRRLGDNAFRNIASKYDRDVQADDYIKVLERLCQ